MSIFGKKQRVYVHNLFKYLQLRTKIIKYGQYYMNGYFVIIWRRIALKKPTEELTMYNYIKMYYVQIYYLS